MKHLTNYTLFLLSAALVARAYHRDRDYRASRRSSRPQDLIADHGGMIQRDFRAEPRQKSNFPGIADSKGETGRRPQSGPTGNNQHIQYSSEENRENPPKLFRERNREHQFDSDSSVDSSDLIKYSHNKESNNNERGYQDNYPERQSQPGYNDNRRKYKMEVESHDPKNAQYSQNAEVDRSREYDSSVSDDSRHLRHESSEAGYRDHRHTEYKESEGKNRRPHSYSHTSESHSAEYPVGKHQEKSYSKENEKNYPSQPHSSRPAANPENNDGQYYAHERPQYDQIPPRAEHRRPPLRESSQYPEYQTENVPYNSDYRDVSLQEQAHIPNDKGSHANHEQHPGNQYYERPEQHDLDLKSSRRLPNRQNTPATGDARKNEEKRPLHQQSGRNAMRVVETKKDMQPAPSEAESQFSEEHDGFLDMGAYTDKQGSFGWYADFPVGKEHDKVTYSFS